MEQTSQSLDVTVHEVLERLNHLPTDDRRGELICLGSRLGRALAEARAAGVRLTGPSARNVAVVLGSLADAFKDAGLLLEADQAAYDSAAEACWADSWQDLTGTYVPCSNDAATEVGLCSTHARQLRSMETGG